MFNTKLLFHIILTLSLGVISAVSEKPKTYFSSLDRNYFRTTHLQYRIALLFGFVAQSLHSLWIDFTPWQQRRQIKHYRSINLWNINGIVLIKKIFFLLEEYHSQEMSESVYRRNLILCGVWERIFDACENWCFRFL